MANGIYENTPDRTNAQLEVAALLEQVTLIATNTRFNDVAVIDGSFTGVTIQAGNTTGETITLSFADMQASGLGLSSTISTVVTQSDATVAMGTMSTVLQTIAQEQAKFGSLINRLDFSIANQSKASVMTEQAIGRIMDADFATETTQLSKEQILNQAATSMLAQANQSKQSILALLQ
jgi:flagellin